MADNVIDSLSIEIDSDIAGAKKNISKLKKTLEELKAMYESVGNVSGNVSEKLRDLASGMNAIANINADGVKAATAAMRGFMKLDFSSMNAIPAGFADNIIALADGVNQFGMQIDGGMVKNAVNSLKKIYDFDFQGLSANVNKLDPTIGAKVRTFMDSFKSISGDFTVSDTLASMQSLFQIDFSGFANFMAEASNGMPNFAAAIQQFSVACASPEFSAAIDKLSHLANVDLGGLAQLSNAGFRVVPDVSAQVDKETAETEESMSKLKTVLSSDLSGKFGFMKSLFSILGTIGKSTLGFLSSGFQKLGTRIKKSNTFLAKFVRSIGRIALYRSIRFLFSEIAKGFKEGTDNLYQYSKAINGQFAKSMDMISTALLYFRNSVAAAAAPTINKLAPAIDALIDKVVECLNWFNELTAKLTGASTWTRALKYPKEYAEATRDANKAMKDFQMGFDELNVINDSGSNSAADALDYSKMFTEMPVDIDFEPWADAFRNAIENSDFYGAGAILGERFNHLFDDVDYKELGAKLGEKINNAIYFANGFLDYSNFTQIGQNAADFLNGGFETIDFYSLGHTIGMSINKIFDVAYGFATKFDWSLLGKSISDGFNGIVDFINIDRIVGTISGFLNGILTTANTFLENANFKTIGDKIGASLSNFDLASALGNITRLIGNLFVSVVNFTSGFLQGMDWQNAGKSLVDGLFSMVSNIPFSKITSSMWEFFGSAAGASFGIVEGVLNELATKAGNFLEENFTDNGKITGESLLNGILETLTNIDTWILTNMLYPFVSGFEKAFKIDIGSSQIMSKDGKKIALGTLDGILIVWSNIGKWTLDNVVNPFIDNFKTGFGIINGNSTKTTELGTQVGEGVKTGILEPVGTIPRAIEETVNDILDKFGKLDFTDTVNKAKNAFTDMKDSISGTIGSIPDAINHAANDIWGAVEAMLNGMIGGFNQFIDNMASFNFNIPDWVPGIGGNSFSLSIPKIQNIQLGRFAFENGGFPDAGQLFMANENGVAEMVGRIGNRTAVANNDQIVGAVAAGVAQAVQAVLLNAQGNDDRNINIYLDGKQIAATVEKYQKQRGVSIYGGGVVNA